MHNSLNSRTAMVTGANVGIGKELARQLANSGDYGKVYLACRNPAKAQVAMRELEKSTGKGIFQIVQIDISDLQSVRSASANLSEPIDDLIMNAGGSGGRTPLALTKDGVTAIFATNVLGHVVLLESLIGTKMLRRAAVLSGSEAARGVPALSIKRPSLETYSVEEFVSLCDGSYFHNRKADGALAYAQVKYVGALWMAALARRIESLRLITMSPGNTRGTDISRDYPPMLRLLMKTILMPIVFPLRGMVHDVSDGAQRLIRGLNDTSLRNGAFYASEADKLTGPVVDQGDISSDLSNEVYQDNAFRAIHRFV